VKINLKYEITGYNQNFINFFGLENNGNLFGQLISNVIPGVTQKVYLKLCASGGDRPGSFLIFRNHSLAQVTEPLVSIIYVLVTKESDAIIVRLVNWLNWIWQLNSSIDNNYNMITHMDESKHRKKIAQLSEMYWFKSLSPLMMHIPNGFIGMISSWAFFDILKIFNNKRGENHFSKDYNRDMLSRIRHSIKKDHGLKKHVEVSDILKDNLLINLRYNNELFIPYSVLKEDIVLSADKDMLLEYILNMSFHEMNTINQK
jgi:hypothetical protein